ncbi:MAG TPA: hypothetical protein VNI77_00345 [Nitrososphaera sp.]|nr:hypothetical protein [Nitrososphaera sp.]
MVKRKVLSMYLSGYNIIHMKLKSGRISPPIRDAVREVVRRNLVGTEMMADGSDNITLQVLLSLPELSVSTTIPRCILLPPRCSGTRCRPSQSSTTSLQKR